MRSPEDDADRIADSLDTPSSFETIFDRHFTTIHRYLARRVGSQLADDLAAATFVEAFRARARYDVSRGDALPWLYGIAANLIRSHRREERRQLEAYARVASGQMPVDDHARVEERIDAETAVAHALAGLLPDDRDTLLLFVWGALVRRGGRPRRSRSRSAPCGLVCIGRGDVFVNSWAKRSNT